MRKTERLFRGIIYWTGVIAFALILSVVIFLFCCRIKYLADNPTLNCGTVTGHSYSDGHPVSVDYVFGEWTIHKTSGDGQEHFYLEVTDDRGRVDYWEVSRGEYEAVKEGVAVTRDLFK